MNDLKISEIFIKNDPRLIGDFQRKVIKGSLLLINPDLRNFIEQNIDDHAENAWLLLAETPGDARDYLLDFYKSDSPIPGARKEGLLDWLDGFNPTNCNDWLMVPFMYSRHIFDDESIDWRDYTPPSATEHMRHFVSRARGLLLWRDQIRFFLRVKLNISNSEADQLWRHYMRDFPDVKNRFDQVRIGESSLSEIIEIHTLKRQYLAGLPDYILSGWLSEWSYHRDIGMLAA